MPATSRGRNTAPQDTVEQAFASVSTVSGDLMGDGRSARKRRAIIGAATDLFLANGYDGTTMDEVGARARVSKQTVYKNFSDKPQLFTEVIVRTAERADAFIAQLPDLLDDAPDLEAAFRTLALRYLTTVMQPPGLQLRRLLIGEATRFPDLADEYFQRAPGRTLQTLAAKLAALSEQGRLRIDDPELAAAHLAYLILGLSLDRAMFLGAETAPTPEEAERLTSSAVQVFMAAYRP